MNKLFFDLKITTIFLFLSSILAVSCVNPDYDLSEGIDTDMTLLQNTAIPLGNVPTISINTLLSDTESGASVFDVDKKGNMSFVFGGETLSQSFKMPEVSIGGDGGLTSEDAVVEFRINRKYENMTGNQLLAALQMAGLPEELYYSGGDDSKLIDARMPIEIDKELPEQILSLKTIDMDATINFNFAVEDDAIIYLEKGFSMEFPPYMVLASGCESADYTVEDNNKVVFNQDTRISHDEPLVINLAFTKLINLESMLVERENEEGNTVRYFTHKDEVIVSGDIFIRASDYGTDMIPMKPDLRMQVELDNLYMTSARVKVDMDIEIEDKKIEIGELPEMFSGEGTVMDLYNPILRIRLDNDSPLEMNLNAEVTSYSGSHTTDIHVGDYCTNGNHETASVIIPAEGEEEYYFSRRGKHYSNDGEDIEIDNLGDIISEIPDSIVIHDIAVVTDDGFITVRANEEFHVNMEYEFFSPLAFDKDLRITFDYDIDLGLNGDTMGLDSLFLSMDMLNSIPLDFNIKGAALDADGNVLKNVSVDMDLDLAAGSLENPVSSPVKIALGAHDPEVSVAMLRLMLTADAPEDDSLIGEALNTAQGLGINNLGITLPHGITIDLRNNDKE